MPRAIIVGGSMAGLFAANLLLRQGWDVELLERTAEGLEARGAGIATQRALTVALARAGVEVSEDLGIRIAHRIGYDGNGRVVGEHDYPQTTTSWGLLYNLLLSAFPPERFHKGSGVVSVFQDSDRAGVRLADGRELTGDLVVGADGMRSSVRAQVAPGIEPVYAGYVAWRGMLEERDMPPGFSAEDFSNFNFGFHGHDELVAYPVAGPGGSIEPGQRRFNMMWYRPADEATLRGILTGNDDRHYEGGIPPQRIRRSVIDEVKHCARALPPIFAETIAKMDNLFVQPIFDLESEEVAFGRIVLIGDAAFVARPHCGAGVSKAAADVLALTDALARQDDVVAALHDHAAQRVPAGKAAVAWARRLGSYLPVGNGAAASESGIGPADVVRYTGIELSETGEVVFTGQGGPIGTSVGPNHGEVVVVDSAAALPELDIVEGNGQVKVLIGPHNGARYRSLHWHLLEEGARLKMLRHPHDSVYYILSGSGEVVDDKGQTQALREGSVVHIERDDPYSIRATDGALNFVGGPCPPDPALYNHLRQK